MKNQPNIQTPITLSNGGTGATDAIGARANLGAQEQSSLLSDIAGLNVSPGDLLYVNSSSQVERLPKGSEGQVLSLQGGSLIWKNNYPAFDCASTWASMNTIRSTSGTIPFSGGGTRQRGTAVSAQSNYLRLTKTGYYMITYGVSFYRNSGDHHAYTKLYSNYSGVINEGTQHTYVDSSMRDHMANGTILVNVTSVNESIYLYIQIGNSIGVTDAHLTGVYLG